jgi:hypothetical protein
LPKIPTLMPFMKKPSFLFTTLWSSNFPLASGCLVCHLSRCDCVRRLKGEVWSWYPISSRLCSACSLLCFSVAKGIYDGVYTLAGLYRWKGYRMMGWTDRWTDEMNESDGRLTDRWQNGEYSLSNMLTRQSWVLAVHVMVM